MAPTKTASKAAPAKKASTHPTFLAMIQECIKSEPTAARQGVSRPTIKKYLADKYKIDMSSASNTNNLSNAIKRGADTGALVLPKGAGGKVKLASKASKPASANKENVAPKKTASAPKKTSAAAPAKKAASAPAKKPTAAASKPAAKPAAAKPAAKKAAPSAAAKKAPAAAPKKKVSSASAAAKKAPAKAPAKKAPTKAAAAKKAPAKKATKA